MKKLLHHFGVGLAVAWAVVSAPAATLAEKISQVEWFSPPLTGVSMEPPSDAESQALWKLFSGDTGVSAYEGMQQFVTAHPSSPWTPAVRAQVAKMHRSYGRYTLALQEWERTWQATKALTNATGRSVAEFTLGQWSQLLASLGRTEKLAELFRETAGWRWQNAGAEGEFAQAREGYHTMLSYPGVSYRCGTMALTRAAEALGHQHAKNLRMLDLSSPSNGFCLSQLVELSDTNQLGFVAVERIVGNEVVIPSVIHWRQNHYAAVLGKKGLLFWVMDPTFGNGQWIAEDFLNEEASGKFLVPATNVPSSWRRLARADTDQVFGKGQPATIHHWEDRGCDMAPGGAGAPPSNTANGGGNQAEAIRRRAFPARGAGKGCPLGGLASHTSICSSPTRRSVTGSPMETIGRSGGLTSNGIFIRLTRLFIPSGSPCRSVAWG